MTDPTATTTSAAKTNYNRFLLLVAGLGGLLYGVDVGIIAGALPYLNDTWGLTGNQQSFIVAAVLLGSVISTLFAGLLSDLMGRKKMMFLSGLLFVISIPVIALAHTYESLVFGRLLQGISAGLIGVVVPLYLAECLASSVRGKGTGIFQWLLTLGIVAAALIGIYYSYRVEEVARIADSSTSRSATPVRTSTRTCALAPTSTPTRSSFWMRRQESIAIITPWSPPISTTGTWLPPRWSSRPGTASASWPERPRTVFSTSTI